MTYALDEQAKTVVARVVRALRRPAESRSRSRSASPVGGYYTYIAYRWVDTNNDGFAQKNEVLTNLGPQYCERGHRPGASDAAVSSPQHDRPDYHANHDNEFILGVDHELMPNFAVGAAYTYRRQHGLSDLESAHRHDVGRLHRGAPVATAGGYSARSFTPERGEGRRQRRRAHPDEPARLPFARTAGSSSR